MKRFLPLVILICGCTSLGHPIPRSTIGEPLLAMRFHPGLVTPPPPWEVRFARDGRVELIVREEHVYAQPRLNAAEIARVESAASMLEVMHRRFTSSVEDASGFTLRTRNTEMTMDAPYRWCGDAAAEEFLDLWTSLLHLASVPKRPRGASRVYDPCPHSPNLHSTFGTHALPLHSCASSASTQAQ